MAPRFDTSLLGLYDRKLHRLAWHTRRREFGHNFCLEAFRSFQDDRDPPLFDSFNGDSWLGSVNWNSTAGAKSVSSDEQFPIAQYTDQQYWLGLIGIGNDRTTLDANTTVSGPLQTLKDSGNIGSLSFGYTAGASYCE